MLRLCSHSSRSYPGRSAPLCISQERRGAVKVAVMEQKSAEAIVDKDSTTHGGVVAGNEPGKAGMDSPCRRAELEEGDVILRELPEHFIPDRVRAWSASWEFSSPG